MSLSADMSADASGDDAEGQWLSYPELSRARGIDKPSAIRLATRRRDFAASAT
jgi:hypothetical protein